MSKRIALPGAIKAIREAKAGWDPRARICRTDPAFGVSAFATTCLMSPAHLCNIEAGRKAVTEDVLHRIAAHLGVPVEAISYEAAEGAVA
jgi:hypothetical protein